MTSRTVFVTGASRGIGSATARAFAALGDKVVLIARDGRALRDIAQEIGPMALAVPCDIRNPAATEDAVLAGVETFGSCDVLVNNAAILGPLAPMARTDPKEFLDTLAVNVAGAFNAIRAVLHLMQAAGHGTIINISSGAAHQPVEGWSAYCASKAALAMLTQQIHHEYGAGGIRAMGLSPGTVATDMQRAIKQSGIGPVAGLDWEDHLPPEAPARAIVWMASEAAAPFAGQELRLRDPDMMERIGL